MEKYTVIVIGCGPAGHTCAVRLAQLGAKVAVVERDYIGGICTNWGCTPSKSMIESAKIARIVREAARYGVNVSSFWVDFKKVAARRDEVIHRARGVVTRLLQHHGIDLYRGEADVIAPGWMRIRKGKLDLDGLEMHYTGEEEEIEAEHIVLATGSRPLMPAFAPPNHPYIVSSNRLITIGELPESLTIVGGGVIGLEFATIFSNMGSRVTIVEFLDRVLASVDPEVSAAITEELKLHGVRIFTGHKVTSVEEGYIRAENQTTHEVVEFPGQAVLIAIGREPVIDQDMFDRVGVEYNRKGIGIDDYLRTNVPGFWAIGDATGKSILAHVGMQQGIVCAENIMAGSEAALRRMDYGVIPAVVYTIPEVVSVGQVPNEADGVESFKVPFSANLRARIEAYEEGFVKIWVKDEVVVAAQAIGHNVSELMQELANMIALKTPTHEVAEIIHAHPTYSEITRSALEYSLGKAVDFIMPGSQAAVPARQTV
jgi:dihydrolipoamide dehydrogenase